MIKSHHSFLLKQLFTTKKTVCPRSIANKTKISPTPCFVSHKNRQYCPCKRRRKDIDKILMKEKDLFPTSS